MIKTMGRLRSKYGATIEDLELPEDIECNNDYLGNWYFISQCKNIPKDIIKRFSMIYLPNKILLNIKPQLKGEKNDRK